MRYCSRSDAGYCKIESACSTYTRACTRIHTWRFIDIIFSEIPDHRYGFKILICKIFVVVNPLSLCVTIPLDISSTIESFVRDNYFHRMRRVHTGLYLSSLPARVTAMAAPDG